MRTLNMAMNYTPGRTNFGMLPEPEGRLRSYITSMAINGMILATIFYVGARAKQVIEHHYELTELILPDNPPPPKEKAPPPPKLPDPPKPLDVKLDAPRLELPKPLPKPEIKPVQMEAKLNLPVIKAPAPSVIQAPEPKPALTAAMPAQNNTVHASTAPVHLGQTFGVTPNPNAARPATVAAIGNPYGGMQGPAVAPHGVVGSTGIGNGLRSGSNAGVVGRVASAGIPGATGTGGSGVYGHVAAASIPAMAAPAPVQRTRETVASTDLEVLSKPPVQYTQEARQLRVEGNVVLRVTFTANGHVIVDGVLHGLGHGLDQEALRVAQQIRFRPATRNGQPVDLTTEITITFQLA
jgi:TonB family protein